MGVVYALSWIAGCLNLASTAPQLLQSLRCSAPGPDARRDTAQIRGRLLQLAGNLTWTAVGILDSLLGLTISCGLSSLLLAALIWRLHARR